MTTHNSAETFPPGEFLREELEARGWSQSEFAEIIGRPARLVNELVAGKRAVTPETAVQLAESLGTSPELWMNLEAQWQLSQVRGRDAEIQRRAQLHGRFPVREMVRRGWIGQSKNVEVMERQVFDFFGISSVDEAPTLAHAARKASYSGVTPQQWAWLFRVRRMAESFVAPRYRKDALARSLEDLRGLLAAPEEVRHVPRILNEAGVRFVLVEALPGSKIDGACLWLSDRRPVIALSTRLDRIDNFWFVLRHEIEHLLQEHGKQSRVMIDEDIFDTAATNLHRDEQIANDAAAQFAVSDAEIEGYVARVNPYFFSRDRVVGFASRLGVHPGIVVGRLHRKLIESGYPEPYKFLREQLVKIRPALSTTAPTDGWGSVYPLQ